MGAGMSVRVVFLNFIMKLTKLWICLQRRDQAPGLLKRAPWQSLQNTVWKKVLHLKDKKREWGFSVLEP